MNGFTPQQLGLTQKSMPACVYCKHNVTSQNH